MIYLLLPLLDISLTLQSPLYSRVLWLHYYYYFNMIHVTYLPIVSWLLSKYWYTLPAFKEHEGLRSFSHEKASFLSLSNKEYKRKEDGFPFSLTPCERDNRIEKRRQLFSCRLEKDKKRLHARYETKKQSCISGNQIKHTFLFWVRESRCQDELAKSRLLEKQ